MNQIHPVRRLKERYGLALSPVEYFDFQKKVIHSKEEKFSNIRIVEFKGIKIYCCVRKNLITTVLPPGEAQNQLNRIKNKRNIKFEGLNTIKI